MVNYARAKKKVPDSTKLRAPCFAHKYVLAAPIIHTISSPPLGQKAERNPDHAVTVYTYTYTCQQFINTSIWLRHLINCVYEQSIHHGSLKKCLDVMQVIHCTRHVLAIPSPHQLCWGDREMETLVLCTKCSYTIRGWPYPKCQ